MLLPLVSVLTAVGHHAGGAGVSRGRPAMRRRISATRSSSSSSSSRSLTMATPAPLAHYDHSVLRPAAEEAAPLLILHGLLGQARNFRSWASALAPALDRPRRVYTVDLRNHGASFRAATMTYDDMADDIVRTMDALAIDRAAILGHSMGGKAAMATALKHRSRVERLCVFDIAPVPYTTADGSNWRQNRELLEALRRLTPAHRADRRSADNRLARDVLDPNVRSFALSNLEQTAAADHLTWKCDLDALVANMDAVAGWDYYDAAPPLPAYEGSTLFVAGGDSRYVRSVHLRKIATTFPRFALETIPNVGHWIHAEAPQRTLDSAKRFLDMDLE